MRRRATSSAIGINSIGSVVRRRFRSWASGTGLPRQLRLAEWLRRTVDRIRRECLDHIVVFDEARLRRILRSCAHYNDIRTHRSLDKDAPAVRPVQRAGSIKTFPILGGLHHRYSGFRFSIYTTISLRSTLNVRRRCAAGAGSFGVKAGSFSLELAWTGYPQNQTWRFDCDAVDCRCGVSASSK